MARFGPDLRHLFVNEAAATVVGRTPEECVGRTMTEVGTPSPLRERAEEWLRHVFRRGEPVTFNSTDGTHLFELQMEPERDAEGRVASVLTIARDVTDRWKMIEALRESERLLAQAESMAHVGSWTWDAQTGEITWSDELYRIYGYEPGAVRPGFQLSDAHLHPGDRELVKAAFTRALERGEPWQLEVRVLGADGVTRFMESRGQPRLAPGGRLACVEGSAQDVTERHLAEQALRESEERFRLVARATNDIIYDWDVATGEIWWSEALRTVLGYSPEEGRLDFAWWEARVHPDDRLHIRESVERSLVSGIPWSAEYRLRRSDGSWATVLDRGFVVADASGQSMRVIGSIVDISEREAMAAQLRHAQKMEAVGRLAGGIAHDFNNVLTAILSTAELAMAGLEPTHPVHADLEEIRAAGARAAALTRQLLAFSRRQVMQPQLLDPNEVVHGAQQLLDRLIGERVSLEVVPDPDAGPVRADRGQLEQVLMNLAVNGRDAMPEGGTLSIVVGRREEPAGAAGDHAPGDHAPGDHAMGDHAPGRYVTIAVRDTGTGMDEATLARAFEPFFTTKPVGQGTGLGLATVYGIVQQSGGYLRAESTPGGGTTVTLHLPEDQGEDAAVSAPSTAPAGPSGGACAGTILLVEDEAAVRSATRRMLEMAGYEVLEARDGVAALELYELHAGAIRLVLSDVVMPSLGGPELASLLRERGSPVPVLLMSGYDERSNGTGRQGDATILPKPFGQGELLRAVEAAMASRVSLVQRAAM
ncbi:MAG TPA: PAS domain-containing protein [Gemmatimonadales bacterium]